MSATTVDLGAILAEESAKLETAMQGRSRRYLTPGKTFVPSVTTVLGVLDKPALVHWSGTVERELCVESFVSMAVDLNGSMPGDGETIRRLVVDRIGAKLACYRKLHEAGSVGTNAHALIEHHLKVKLGFHGMSEPEIPSGKQGEAALWAYLQFEDYAKDAGLEPVAMEVGVWSEAGFAGRLDLLARVKDELSILDWKTGKDIYPEAKYQNAGYRLALNQRLDALGRSERVVAGHIVLLPKNVDSDAKFRVEAIGDDTEALDVFLSALRLWRALESFKKAGGK